MIRKRGGQPAKRGSYWDTRSWQIFVVGKDGEVLPGGPDHLYLRLNLVEMILFALAISGMYLLFVPFVGFVAFAIDSSQRFVPRQKISVSLSARSVRRKPGSAISPAATSASSAETIAMIISR